MCYELLLHSNRRGTLSSSSSSRDNSFSILQSFPAESFFSEDLIFSEQLWKTTIVIILKYAETCWTVQIAPSLKLYQSLLLSEDKVSNLSKLLKMNVKILFLLYQKSSFFPSLFYQPALSVASRKNYLQCTVRCIKALINILILVKNKCLSWSRKRRDQPSVDEALNPEMSSPSLALYHLSPVLDILSDERLMGLILQSKTVIESMTTQELFINKEAVLSAYHDLETGLVACNSLLNRTFIKVCIRKMLFFGRLVIECICYSMAGGRARTSAATCCNRYINQWPFESTKALQNFTSETCQ